MTYHQLSEAALFLSQGTLAFNICGLTLFAFFRTLKTTGSRRVLPWAKFSNTQLLQSMLMVPKILPWVSLPLRIRIEIKEDSNF
jgi:hypothetical protein